MGYRSNFYLNVSRRDGKTIDLSEAKEMTGRLETLTGEKFEELSYDTNSFQIMAEDTKWYDCEDNLKQFTSMNPDIVIDCTIEGEDHDDTRRMFFREGECFDRSPVHFTPPFKDGKTKTLLLVTKEHDRIRLVSVPEYDMEQSVADYERFGYETLVIKSADIFGTVTEF